MNLENVTILDCMENYERKGMSAELSDGKLYGFTKEEKCYPSSEWETALKLEN